MKHFNIIVSGHVQGVGYRWQAKKKAQQLGLKGFVSNQSDGNVYLEVEGSQERLKDFIAWCKIGPENARIGDLDVNEAELKAYSSFSIKHQ